jgi:tetratricopeptide (TPR) repeat protein
LALACYELQGDLEKVFEKYQSFYNNVTLPSYGLPEDFYYFRECSLVNHNIAKIYEKLGDTEKAIEHYEKFLDLWKDADPGFVEVVDAKKKLAGLKE